MALIADSVAKSPRQRDTVMHNKGTRNMRMVGEDGFGSRFPSRPKQGRVFWGGKASVFLSCVKADDQGVLYGELSDTMYDVFVGGKGWKPLGWKARTDGVDREEGRRVGADAKAKDLDMFLGEACVCGVACADRQAL